MHTSVPRYVTRSRGDGRGVMFEGAVTRSRAGATPRPGRRDPSQGRKRTPAHFFKAITGRKPSPPPTGVPQRKTLKAETLESGSGSESVCDSAEDHDVTIDNVNNVRDFKTNSIDENQGEHISHGSDDNKVSSLDSSDEIDTTPEQPSPTISNHGFSFSTQGFPIFMAVPGMTPVVLGEVLTSAGAPDPSCSTRPTSPVPPYPTLEWEQPLWPLEDHQTTDIGDVNWVSLYGEWTGGFHKEVEDLVDHGNDQAQGKSGKGNHYL